MNKFTKSQTRQVLSTIVGFTAGIAMSFGAVLPTASAQTISELQAQITNLLATIQGLQARLASISNTGTAAESGVTPLIPIGSLPGGNLIKNPSLEIVAKNGDPTGWLRGGHGNNLVIFQYPYPRMDDHGAMADGALVAKLEMTSYTDGDAKWYFADVPVTAGKPYRIEYAYRATTDTKIVARYTMVDGTFEYQFLGNASTTKTWTKATYEVTPPQGTASLTVFHAIQSIGSLEIDNFSLVALPLKNVLPANAGANASSTNLISNPSLQAPKANGNPIGWFRGGYGENAYSREHRVVPCKYPAECPPNTLYRLEARIATHEINGDAKWYFADVPIANGKDGEKDFKVSYQYQAYTSRASAIARYAFQDGSYRHIPLGYMTPSYEKGSGYAKWSNAEHKLSVPEGATSMTIFFTVQGNEGCKVPCVGPEHGILSIANVVLASVEKN